MKLFVSRFVEPLTNLIKFITMSKSKAPPPILANLTELELKTYHAAFDWCDLIGSGLVNKRDVATGFRLLLRNPTYAEVEAITTELDTKKVGSLDFVQFVTALSRPAVTPLIVDEDVREAFRCLDNTDDCKIPAQLFINYMTALGERLDEEEMKEMMKYADPQQTEFVDYEKFVTIVFSWPKFELVKKKGKKGKKGKKK